MAAKPALSEVEGVPALQSQDAPVSAKLLPRLLPLSDCLSILFS
jgi:hypothetical protein